MYATSVCPTGQDVALGAELLVVIGSGGEAGQVHQLSPSLLKVMISVTYTYYNRY